MYQEERFLRGSKHDERLMLGLGDAHAAASSLGCLLSC